MTCRSIRDVGSDAAVITAAFLFRNAVVILTLAALALIAFAGA